MEMGGESNNSTFWTSMERKVKSKIAVALIYAVLEWALIILLLLQGLFSRFVTSFASYFALHPPCILCSRLDHLFDRRHGRLAYRRLLCNSHMLEISDLRYCSLHRKLSDASSSSTTKSCSCFDERDASYEVDASSSPRLEATQIVDSSSEEEEMRKIESWEGNTEKPGGIIHDADSVRDSELEESGAAEDDNYVTNEVRPEGAETIKISSVLVEEEESPSSEHQDNLEGVSSEIVGFEACEKVEETTDLAGEHHHPIGNGDNNSAITIEKLEMVEEKSPETPLSGEGVCLLEREQSMDSTEGNAMDGQEDLTVEQLETALKAERRALNALYSELEEERNASAIAANHTMAMITRLQEEKAAMQMEALHYQRMMEDQSEYDQEALKLLNELMVRREKDNQELEKELEICRRRLAFYEKKERQRSRSNSANERSSIPLESSASADGSDDISVSLDGIEVNLVGVANGNALGLGEEKESTTLDESFAGFEKERISILDHLRELEEKLFLMGDDSDLQKNMRRMDHLMGENGDVDGASNGFLEDEHHHSYNYDEDAKVREVGFTSNRSSNHMKVAMEEELQDIYERLSALEADGEFLKHSVGTLKKGDKGMELLVEILQNLRDLRSIEQRDQIP